MRPSTALIVLVLVVWAISACADTTATTTSAPTTTVSEDPPAASTTTARQTLRHLLDGSAITMEDSNRDLAITHGSRAEIRLSQDYAWSDPQIAGPGELVPVTPPDDAGYVAWELITSGPGNLVISATGVPNCGVGECGEEDIEFSVSIAIRQP